MTTMHSNLAAQTPLGGNRGVLAAANTALANGDACVLAIVVSTSGSTYRKPGALAMVMSDGATQGVISGGCLESALQDAAAEVLSNDVPQSLLFDTQSKDDLVFGSGSACRGTMQVLLVPVRPGRQNDLHTVIDRAHRCHLVLKLALVMQPPWLAHGFAWSGSQEWQMAAPLDELRSLQNATLGEHKISTSDATVAVFECRPAPRLLMIGAGPEAVPLMSMARRLGWFITLVDHRPAALQAHSTDADCKITARPLAAFHQLTTQTFDAALVMTHTAAADLEALQALALRAEPYVGLLGPPARRDELLAQLNASARDALKARLHAPLGLRLGGDGPEPLALSIAAELQRFFAHAQQ